MRVCKLTNNYKLASNLVNGSIESYLSENAKDIDEDKEIQAI